MKKPDQSPGAPVAANPAMCEDMATWPRLWEHLADDKWDDGSAREPSSLSVFVADGQMKACLNDRDSECSLYVSGATLVDCLTALEKRLNGDKEADWRAWGKKKKRK